MFLPARPLSAAGLSREKELGEQGTGRRGGTVTEIELEGPGRGTFPRQLSAGRTEDREGS